MVYPPPFAGYPRVNAHEELEREQRLAPGWVPGYARVWKDGRDVTDEPPETWPWPWNPRKRPGQR